MSIRPNISDVSRAHQQRFTHFENKFIFIPNSDVTGEGSGTKLWGRFPESNIMFLSGWDMYFFWWTLGTWACFTWLGSKWISGGIEIELNVYNKFNAPISVLQGSHLHLSQVKHARVKCLAHGHKHRKNVPTSRGEKHDISPKTCLRQGLNPHGRQWRLQSTELIKYLHFSNSCRWISETN